MTAPVSGLKTVDDDEMKLFFVLFSQTRGVFLGEKIWSYDDEEKVELHNCAITFRGNAKADMAVAHMKEKGIDCMKIQVWPDLNFNLASVDACANAGLPRWTFDEAKIKAKAGTSKK